MSVPDVPPFNELHALEIDDDLVISRSVRDELADAIQQRSNPFDAIGYSLLAAVMMLERDLVDLRNSLGRQ